MENFIQNIIDGRDFYIGDLGNIYRKTVRGIKALPKYKRNDGYEYVQISCGGARKKFSVHRLVAEAFLENPNNLPQVNHIDGNKRNNSVDNLEWVNNSSNQFHSRYVLGNTTGFKDRPIICIETGELFVSTRDAWRKKGVNYCHISECASGKRKSAGGFKWRYAEEDEICTI